MPGFNPSQVSFAGGEISPRLAGRVDSDLYKKALSLCRNWEPYAMGSALMRAGTKYVSLLGGDARNRLIPFRTASGQDFAVALTEGVAKVYNSGGPLVGGTTTELVINGTFSPAGANWTTVAGSPQYPGGQVKLPRLAKISQACTAPAGTVSAQLSVDVTAIHNYTAGGETFVAEPHLRLVQGGVSIAEIYPMTGGIHVVSAACTPGTITVELDNSGGDPGTYWNATSVSLRVANSSVVSIVAPWTAAQLAEVSYASMPAQDLMVIVHPNVEPRVLAHDAAADTWSLTAISAMAGYQAPAGWAASDYPRSVEVWQNRLWLGGSPTYRNRIWASRSGALYDFRLATGTSGAVLASDGIDVLASTKGQVNWLHGRRVMLIGTDDGELHLTSQGGAVTPLDIGLAAQSAHGSAAIQSADAGDQIIYVSRDARRIRATSYSNDEQTWLSRDVTLVAEHLTTHKIKEVHFCKEPNRTIVALLQDGNLACCTYERGEQVQAWWLIELTGLVGSAAVCNGVNGSELFLSVSRAGGYYLEVLSMFDSSDRQYLDAWKTVAVPAGATPTITGLDHLDGETVGIVLDGALEADQVVVGGALTLARAGSLATVGLRYGNTLKQLPLEGGLAGGSSQTAKRRVTKARLRLNNSAIPLVNGKRAAERTPADPMDTGTDLVTGDVDYQVLGWEEDGALTIEQDLPFRTEILAVFTNAQVNEV